MTLHELFLATQKLVEEGHGDEEVMVFHSRNEELVEIIIKPAIALEATDGKWLAGYKMPTINLHIKDMKYIKY